MVFNSLEFAFFFIIVVAAYFALPHRFRWALLLIASYYFYMSWKVEYGFLLLATTFVDYATALGIEKAKKKRLKAWLLSVSLLSNLGMLFAFKYFTFAFESLQAVFRFVDIPFESPAFKLLLPVGISFYVFQSLSYTIEVYRGNQKAERHFGIFALYVSFFPQLVAGPIERSTHLLPQFRKVQTFEYRRVVEGLKLIAWGLFKKMVIADRLAEFVNVVYGAPGEHSGAALVLGTYFFAFQIYCDFSGYSDIAIGTANVMGFDFMNNFERPYFSKSITEFWRRWHISLSSWFRDYVYYPLGGNRKGVRRQYLSLMLVFLVSGLWHGASWTFVLWGALHGLYSVIGRTTFKWRDQWYERFQISALFKKYWRMIITFHLVCFGWVLFRAQSVSDVGIIVKRIVTAFNPQQLFTETQGYHVVLGVLWIFCLVSVELIQRQTEVRVILARQSAPVRWFAYSAIVAAILLFGKFGGTDFIYFQF